MAQEANGVAPDESSPPIAALFLVVFDRKVGYTIAWKRSISDGSRTSTFGSSFAHANWDLVELDGTVEYKSLPSGLHNVQSDLIYFIHEEHAGLSAFVSHPAEEADRNAHFVAVGILVPLSFGRLGRSWLHGAQLLELAQQVVQDTEDNTILEEYWESHRLDKHRERAEGIKKAGSPSRNQQPRNSDRTRHRTFSSTTSFDNVLSAEHPALSLPNLLDTFGPLLFPLHRAALLRKRILLIGSAPVQRQCNYVYDLSIISNIPPSLSDRVPANESSFGIRPLFNVGVHDIPFLQELTKPSEEEDDSEGWIACTTDDILGSKTQLWDLVVELPSELRDSSNLHSWPRIRTSDGRPVKATQRDLRRYSALRRELQRLRRLQGYESKYTDEEGDAIDGETDDTTLLPRSTAAAEEDNYNGVENEPTIVEPSSWAAIAYTSFLWWASAGEKDALLADEESQESSLLDDLPVLDSTISRKRRSSGSSKRDGKRATSSRSNRSTRAQDDRQETAMVLIAYFHRLTTLVFETMAEMVKDVESTDEEEDEDEAVIVDSDGMARMGLDGWSEADKEWAQDMFRIYFGRDVEVQRRSIDCCGVRIC